MREFLSDVTAISRVSAAVAAGTTAVNGTGVDMSGWDGVLFVASFGTPAADNLLHAEQSSDDADADAYAELAGSEITPGGASDELQAIDILNPRERYVRCVALRGTSSTLEAMWAIRYKGKSPITNNNVADTFTLNKLLHPAEGTK